MRIVQKTTVVLLVLSALLTACGGVATPQQPNLDVILTEGVQTMVASYFETQTALVPPATATSLPTFPPFETNTPNPFLTPSPIPSATLPFYTATFIYYTPTVTGTVYTPTINPDVLAYGCNNLAFLTDVTIPSGTVLKPGEDFTKTWKVANTGTCNWMYQYDLTLISGDAFGAKYTRLGRVVTAGHWASLSLGMTAPKNPGTYTAYWRMADADGNPFGATLAVSFKVAEPTNTPKPTNTTAPSDTPTPTATEAPTTP